MYRDATGNHWHNHSKQWDKLGSPLRPNKEDLSFYQRFVSDDSSNLILGLTPELCRVSGKSVIIDSCHDRIKLLFKKNELEQYIIQADWLHFPLAKHNFDVVLGDGVFTQLIYPNQYITLFKSILPQIKTRGKIVTRIFVNNETCTSVNEICLLANKRMINSFHAFKWRFVMALLNERNDINIPVVDIFNTFNRYCPDRESLSYNSKWDIDTINTIDVYQGSSAIYSFPTLLQLNKIVPDAFKEDCVHYGNYELAESCPIIVWNKTHDQAR